MGFLNWLANLWGPVDDVPAAPSTSVALTEAGTPMLLTGNDPDAKLTLAQGGGPAFRRLSATKRDLPKFTEERAREVAWALYETNPLGKRIPELIRDYVLGEDVALVVAAEGEDGDKAAEATRTQRQAIIDGFWSDPINRLGMAIDDYILDLGLFGELCLTVAVNPANGQVRLGYIDPAMIADVLTDPRTPLIPAELVIRAAAGTDVQRLRVVRVDLDPTTTTYGRLIGVRVDASGVVLDTYRESPDGPEKPYLGACFFWAINKPVSARRGRSDLLALAEWIDGLDQILFGEIDRQLLMKSFIWDVMLKGMSETQIAAWLAVNSAPPPGSIRAHNEEVEWNAVTPDLKAFDTRQAVDTLLGYIATGAGLPKTWLSSTDDVNRATASELSEPAFKRLTRRQKLVKAILVGLGTFALDQAELAGVLGETRPAKDGTLPAPWPLSAQMPELRPKDLAAGTTAMNQGASALATLRADNAIDGQVHQGAAVVLLGQIGVEVDLKAMRERIEVEQAEAEKKEAEMFAQQAEMDGDGQPANGNGREQSGRMAVMAKGR